MATENCRSPMTPVYLAGACPLSEDTRHFLASVGFAQALILSPRSIGLTAREIAADAARMASALIAELRESGSPK